MGIKQDYILKLIEEVIDFLLLRICGLKEKDKIIENFSNLEESKNKFTELENLIAEKNVNEAENKLFEYLDDENEDNIKIALLFYDSLNKKTDDFLKESNFSREEIKDGIIDVIKKFGYDNLIDIYF